MMYGFGDLHPSVEESVEIIEELTIKYMRDVVSRAASISRRESLSTNDILFVVRKDRKKLWRGGEACSFHKEHERASQETRTGKDPTPVARLYDN